MKNLKRVIITAICFCIAISAYSTVTPTGGWWLSTGGAAISNDNSSGLGSCYNYGLYFGADVNRWSSFFGEFSFGVGKSEYDLSLFSGPKPFVNLSLGGGWSFSPGSGWSIATSAGLSLIRVSLDPTVYVSGLYLAITPRWSAVELFNPYYNISFSFPCYYSICGNVSHLRVGIAIGGDVSIYKNRRGNSFLEVSY